MKQTLTIVDKLLLAAHEIESKGRVPFSAEDLVVEAWTLFPDVFGLAGHNDEEGKPKYPDSNRVYAEIMGSKPIRKRGFLNKVGRKMYKLTEAGKRQVKDITAIEVSTAEKMTLPRDTENEIRRLMESRAANKVRFDKLDELNFHDACAFWGISPRSNAKHLWGRFKHTELVIKAAIDATKGKDSVTIRHGGIPYTYEDMKTLKRVHEVLTERFDFDLEYIRGRTDERRS